MKKKRVRRWLEGKGKTHVIMSNSKFQWSMMDKPSTDWCSFANCIPLEPTKGPEQGPKAGM